MKYKKSIKLRVFLLFLFLILSGISFLSISNNKQHITEDQPLMSQPDDYYEENDFPVDYYDLSYYRRDWLSSINGMGAQYDDDWFQIYIEPGYNRLIIFLIFSYDNLGIDVYADDFSTLIASSDTFDNNEFINVTLPENRYYYIKIYGPSYGTLYDLLWEALPTGLIDDYYEPNNNLNESYYIWQNDWMSWQNGLGIISNSTNEDYYEINFVSSTDHLMIELISLGDINFEIYDFSKNPITGNYLYTGHGIFDYFLSSGTYYLRIYGDGGEVYNLRYSTFDDDYEENDDWYEAYTLSSYEAMWLNSIEGSGIQADDDWYEIYIDPGEERIHAELTYFHEPGKNIDMEIWYWDYNFTTLAGSYDIDGDEYIDVDAPWSGNYYIKVFGENASNDYNLFWEDLTSYGYDDSYEDNDDMYYASDIAEDERSWLKRGPGIQSDDDWYKIYLTPGFTRLVVNMTFDHSKGDINIAIYDKEGGLRGDYTSLTSGEYVDARLSPWGTYYIRVYGDDTGNEYDLWWDDLRPNAGFDDRYEPNDNYTSAFDLSPYKNMWLHEINEYGVNLNDDWYEFYVSSDFTPIDIFMNYSIREGGIFLELYDSGPNRLIRSSTFEDNEIINYEIQSNGTYYLRVYGGNMGNVYDLILNLEEDEDEGFGEIPGYDVLILIGSMIGISIVIIIKRKKK